MERQFQNLEKLLSPSTLGELPDGSESLTRIAETLDALQNAVEQSAQSRVNRFHAPSLMVEAKTSELFGSAAILPSEEKIGQRWQFVENEFNVQPHHLYFYSLRFKATRTIRIKSVTLVCRDGARLVYDQWSGAEGGNGVAFEKRTYLPTLNAYSQDEPRQARALEKIIVLGSAQDQNLTASLDFLFEVPDPDSAPYQKTLQLIAKMKRNLTAPARGTRPIDRWPADMKLLSDYLRLGL